MKLASNRELPWTHWPNIRGDLAAVQPLLQGHSGAVDDYELLLSRIIGNEQHSPRHKHVFDQFRCALENDVPLNPGLDIPKGSIAYLPEGLAYGPFSLPQDCMMLSLQFGGPGGGGHVHTEDLQTAHKELARNGNFDKGVYTWIDKDGRKHNKDAHRVVWERITGRDIDYPAPRYAAPVIINPDNYQWLDAGPLASTKLLGVYNERGTCLKMIRLQPKGVHVRNPGPQAEIYFVKEGACSVGEGICEKWDAFRIEDSESATITGVTGTTLLVFGMPDFRDLQQTA